MEQRIRTGDVVRHFKREFVAESGSQKDDDLSYLYEVISVDGLDADTQASVVVYRALYGTHQVYVRPYKDFMGEVDRRKYPTVKQQYRFERV